MNIFLLDLEPGKCAAMHCDKHIVKMATEYAQLLSTAARLLGYEHDGYRNTHTNHPCTQWAAKNVFHWCWLYRLAEAVGCEYTKRYGREHAATKALEKLPDCLRVCAKSYLWSQPKEWPIVVPEDCLVAGKPAQSYQAYYLKHKAYFAKWRYSAEPAWWKNNKIQGYTQLQLA